MSTEGTEQTLKEQAEGAQVQVRFHTKQQKYAITDAPILVPARLKRYELSGIVNHLLAAAKPIPFSFLIDGKFLTTSLQAYLNSHGLSTENILDVEYVESTIPPKHTASFKHDDWICAVRASRTSPYVATGSYDNHARIWDRSGNCVAVLQAHEKAVKSTAWIEAGQGQASETLRLLSGGLDGRVCGWEYATSSNKTRLAFTTAEQTGSVESIAVNASGSHFAAATYGGAINVYFTAEDEGGDEEEEEEESGPRKRRRTEGRAAFVKRAVSVLDAHVGAVSSIVFDQGSAFAGKVYSGGYDHSVRVWDMDSGANTSTMNCEVTILDADHSERSGLLVTGHTDNLLRLWDPRVQEGLVVKLKLASHKNWVSSVSWSPTSIYTLASGSYDGTIKVWDIRSTTPLYSLSGGKNEGGEWGKVLALDWADGFVLSGGEDSELRVHVCKS
ncbi:hypothetical protein HDV00_002357 [Rhizophlyctis rosea]|nr:hypothetical protein HDV00_002357 [Rhizophlyctis rosea]